MNNTTGASTLGKDIRKKILTQRKMEAVNLTGCLPGLIESHEKIIILSVNAPLSITAVLGNVLIIVALQKPLSSLHPASKLLFGCLACTDLCVGLIVQPLLAIFLMSPHLSKVCYDTQIALSTLGVVFNAVSLMTLSAISVDRLLVLLLGLRYREVVTLSRVQVLVAAFWLVSIAMALIMFFYVRIATSLATVVLILCTVTSTFCYTKIYIALRHHQTAVQDQGEGNGRRNALNIARYKKTVSSALWLQITLLACYLPHGTLLSVLAIFGSVTPSIALNWALTLSLLYFNSSLNPFLYCWKMREVRQAVKNMIIQCWCS